MLYVILSKDVRSAEGRLYAKRGKRLRVLFRNGNHYLCEVGKLTVPVFSGSVSKELTVNEDEEKIEEIEELGPEGQEGRGSLDEIKE